jgi:hypothetical protein
MEPTQRAAAAAAAACSGGEAVLAFSKEVMALTTQRMKPAEFGILFQTGLNMHPAAAQYKLVAKDCRALIFVPFLECKSTWSLRAAAAVEHSAVEQQCCTLSKQMLALVGQRYANAAASKP